jgi:hypothetical protein
LRLKNSHNNTYHTDFKSTNNIEFSYFLARQLLPYPPLSCLPNVRPQQLQEGFLLGAMVAIVGLNNLDEILTFFFTHTLQSKFWMTNRKLDIMWVWNKNIVLCHRLCTMMLLWLAEGTAQSNTSYE